MILTVFNVWICVGMFFAFVNYMIVSRKLPINSVLICLLLAGMITGFFALLGFIKIVYLTIWEVITRKQSPKLQLVRDGMDNLEKYCEDMF